MSSFSYSHFFSKNISVYAIFSDQSFYDTLTNDIVSFEQLGPGLPDIRIIKSWDFLNLTVSATLEEIAFGHYK